MQVAQRGEEALATDRRQDAAIIGIDENRRALAGFVARKARPHGGARLAGQHHQLNLAGARLALQPRHDLIRRQHRRRSQLDPGNVAIERGDDLVLERQHRAGQAHQGDNQCDGEADNGMNLQEGGFDRRGHGQQKYGLENEMRRVSAPAAAMITLTAPP